MWLRKISMTVSPLAGKPAEPSTLVNVPKLITAYYTETPDSSIPEQRISFDRHDYLNTCISDPGGWFAAHPSGTEDIYKIYAESFREEDHLRRILEEAQTIVNDALATASHG